MTKLPTCSACSLPLRQCILGQAPAPCGPAMAKHVCNEWMDE